MSCCRIDLTTPCRSLHERGGLGLELRARRHAARAVDPAMGRLENIIARNRRPNRMNERLIASMVLGAIVLLIIALAVFTDLGVPPEERDAREAPAAPAPPSHGKRVDGVLLRASPARPAQQ